MNFNEYQELASTTAIYPNKGEVAGLMYTTLGLTGEAGEIANKVKKMHRDGYDRHSQGDALAKYNEARANIKGEISDCIWYLSQIAKELDLSFEEIAEYNINKLKSRQQRGVLGGSGDNR